MRRIPELLLNAALVAACFLALRVAVKVMAMLHR